MLFLSLSVGFVAIILSFLVVTIPILVILEFFGFTDLFDEENKELDDHIKECKREHPSNFM